MNYIAINPYRSSTSHGFANKWDYFKCSKEDRRLLLGHGMPVKDVSYSDGSPFYSTMGIRGLTI